MFDFILWLGKNELSKDIHIPWGANRDLYKDCTFGDWEISGFNFRIKFLNHEEPIERNYFEKDGVHVFLAGRMFSNNKYREETQIPVKVLQASSVYDLYLKYGPDMVKYVKGIFILCIFDEDSTRYYVFNNRFGLLNLYAYMEKKPFLFSTSLNYILEALDFLPEIDEIAVLQSSLLNFSFKERTFFKSISKFPPGAFFVTDLAGHYFKRYDDPDKTLKEEPRWNWNETLEEIPSRFNEAVKLSVMDLRKFCASLTGGFASRSVLSILLQLNKDILYYSWGKKNSPDLHIPEKIANHLGLKYRSLVLDEKFIDFYDIYARQAVYFSDGVSTIQNAHQAYGYSFLTDHSPFFVTGLFGSELLCPSEILGTIFNNLMISLLLEPEKRNRVLREKYRQEMVNKLFKNERLEKHEEEFIEEVLNVFQEFDRWERPYKRIYSFLLREGFRKWLGGEINMVRFFGHIVSPFVDDEFVEFLLMSPFPFLKDQVFHADAKTLKREQNIFLPILRENDPRLIDIRTSWGYAPRNLEVKNFSASSLSSAVLSAIKKRWLKPDDFFAEKGCLQVYQKNENIFSFETDLFLPLETDVFRRIDLSSFFRHFSLRLSLSRMLKRLS
ncbi:MAG: hypothetical protein JXB26_03450 [Candidatus Aminicenantes bacterium]|nr:hypothetical protein [Candidatus Aminicenantes bacterium]